MLTFKDLQDRVLRYLDEAGDTDTTLALVKDALNAANTLRAAKEKWPFLLWDAPVTLSIVPGQRVYTLHPQYHRPLYFYNQTVRDYLTQTTTQNLVASNADWNNDTGSALSFTLWSRSPVAQQPSSASALTLSSSSATDNGSMSVTVRGDTAQGVTTETIVCGTTGSVAFTRILRVTKSDGWTGTLTLAAGATTLLTLFSEEAGRSYQQLRLLASPDTAETVEYLFYRQPTLMENDNDLPDIPPPYELLLVYDALLYFASYNEYTGTTVELWKLEQQKWQTALEQSMSDDTALEARVSYVDYVPR